MREAPGSKPGFSIFVIFNIIQADQQDSEVVKDLVKTFACTASADGIMKTVVIMQAERLSFGCQAAMRRLIEDAAKMTRFILVTENLSGVIPPLQSRTLKRRCCAPRWQTCVSILKEVMQKEGISEREIDFEGLKFRFGCDMGKLLVALESAFLKNEFRPANLIPPWERVCQSIANTILKGPYRNHLFKNEDSYRDGLFIYCVNCG